MFTIYRHIVGDITVYCYTSYITLTRIHLTYTNIICTLVNMNDMTPVTVIYPLYNYCIIRHKLWSLALTFQRDSTSTAEVVTLDESSSSSLRIISWSCILSVPYAWNQLRKSEKEVLDSRAFAASLVSYHHTVISVIMMNCGMACTLQGFTTTACLASGSDLNKYPISSPPINLWTRP